MVYSFKMKTYGYNLRFCNLFCFFVFAFSHLYSLEDPLQWRVQSNFGQHWGLHPRREGICFYEGLEREIDISL